MEFVALMEGEDPTTTTGIRNGALQALKIMGLDEANFRNGGGDKRAKAPAEKKPVKAKARKPTAKPVKAKQDEPEEELAEINPPLKFNLELDQDHSFFDDRDSKRPLIPYISTVAAHQSC